MVWTGNGLADGTTITSGNVNTAGNGATLDPPTGTLVTSGDGFTFGGAAAAINRQNMSFTAAKAARLIAFYTPPGAPTTGNERLLNFRSSGATATGLSHATGGYVSIEQGSTEIVASRSPALTNGHRYRIDMVTALSASPTSSNGRIFYEVRDLTDPTWNTTGKFFYDTGYAVNAGTVDLSIIRFGKLAGTGVLSSSVLLEAIDGGTITVSASDTTQAQAEAYFFDTPYRTAASGVTLSGAADAADAAGPSNARGATGGVTFSGTATSDQKTGQFAGIGDSTWFQDGNGQSRITAKLAPKGYTSAEIWFYARVGKAISYGDDLGYTTLQNMTQARTALGGEPDVWLFNLGSNGHHDGDSLNVGWINAVLDNVGPSARVYWVGISQATGYDNGTSSETTRRHWNSIAQPVVAARSFATWLDWDTYIKAYPGGDSAYWQADGVHMTDAGYDIKNKFTTDAIGANELTPGSDASSGVTLTGTATAIPAATVTATGSVGLAGTAAAAVKATAVGGVVPTGAAYSGAATAAVSGVTLAGQGAVVGGTPAVTATGGVALGGSAAALGYGGAVSCTASGGLLLSGSALASIFGAVWPPVPTGISPLTGGVARPLTGGARRTLTRR